MTTDPTALTDRDFPALPDLTEDWVDKIIEAFSAYMEGAGGDGRDLNTDLAKIISDIKAGADIGPAQAQVMPLPDDIAAAILRIGRADCGVIKAQNAEQLVAILIKSIGKAHESLATSGPLEMHGIQAEGSGMVICLTGTSSNSPTRAKALTAAWNWMHDSAKLSVIPPQQASGVSAEGTELHGPYAWLIKPIGLAEDSWSVEADPSPYSECISVPLFAKEAQVPSETIAPASSVFLGDQV